MNGIVFPPIEELLDERQLERLRELRRRPLRRQQRSAVRHATGPLTTRQHLVLALVAEGLSNREIAALFVVSEETVKSQLRVVLAKLDAKSRAHAVAIAFRRGLLT